MPSIFNNFPSPSLFSHSHFRLSYSLLPPIRNLISHVGLDVLNVVSIGCGAALEVSTFELLARSRGVKINYFGCDINKRDLRFNTRVLQKKSPNVRQAYIQADVANNPPVSVISDAHCIIWRHPEFLSDHAETPKNLILDMCHILWNILAKDKEAPILITSYDPHEMMLILELLKQFCEEDLKYDLTIDTQPGRASWQNPTIDPEDRDPIFNLNHHDQCQLLITHCHPKRLAIHGDIFITALAQAFQAILPSIQPYEQKQLSALLEHLDKPNLDVLRDVTSYLNEQIGTNDNPFLKREQLGSLLIKLYKQPEISHQFTY